MVADQHDQRDARVAAAEAHWANRFVSNGTDYADFAATLSRITRWEDWCREWGRTGQRYEELAERSEADGLHETAAGAWRRAALAWHWGKFVFVDDPVQQRAAHDRAVACFLRCASALSPPAERVRIPYAGTLLPAYLRVPATRTLGAQSSGVRPAVVIMIPGLDSTKEELQATAEYFLARGLATLAVDGPGQGESEYDLPIEPAYEKVATAVVDYLKTPIRGDNSKIGGGGGVHGAEARERFGAIGLFGVSLGGYYAARAAAFEPRITATVALAGPYRFDQDWDSLPPQTRATFQHRSFAKDPDEARARAGELTLEHAASKITRPLLIVGGGHDRIVPASHQERLATEAPGSQLVIYPDGGHGVTNHAYASRSRMADWLAAHLATADPAPATSAHPES